MFPKTLPNAEHELWTHSDCSKENFEYSRVFIHKNYNMGMHTHSFYEINIVIGGHGRHYIEKNSVEAECGSVFVIPPNIKHGYYNEKNLDVLHILLFDSFFQSFEEELKSLAGYHILFEIEPLIRSEFKQDLFLRLSGNNCNSIIELFNTYDTLFPASSEGRTIFCNALSLELCVLLCRYASEYFNIKSKVRPQDKAIMRSMEYMKNNISEDISIETLAKQSFLSKTSYERRFKSLCGCTPMQYLLDCRLSKAKSMLKSEEHTVAEIALECGFYDASHLNRYFKRKFKITPRKFRNNQK